MAGTSAPAAPRRDTPPGDGAGPASDSVPAGTTADDGRSAGPETQAPDWRRVTAHDGTPIGWRRSRPSSPGTSERVPVVLCNGIACSTDHWSAVAPRLRADRVVVEWDYRGHGVSGHPAAPDAVDVDDVVADLDRVLRAASVDRAVFVGHSFGVQVALEAAARWPERVAGVVAVAGSAGRPLPPGAAEPPFGVLYLLARLHTQLSPRADDAWRQWWTSPAAHLALRAVGGTSVAASPTIMRAYYEHVSTRDVPVLLAMMRRMQAHDASDVIPRLRAPLLALAGDADRITPLPVMARLALEAPDGELAVCHGATHTLPVEHPDWVVDHLGPLLEKVDAGRTTVAPARAAAR